MNKKKIKIKFYLLLFLLSLIITFTEILIISSLLYFSNYKYLFKKNKETSQLIKCDKYKCDISDYVNYPKDDVSNFIITRDGFFIDISNEFTDLNLPFNYVDIKFLDKFAINPLVYESITEERWLIYTKKFNINKEDFYLMTALALDVPWRIYTIEPQSQKDNLMKETENMVSKIISDFEKYRDINIAMDKLRPKVDAFQVVDKNGRVLSWNWGIPSFISKEKLKDLDSKLPRLTINKGKIFIIDKLQTNNLYFISIKEFDLKFIVLFAILSLLLIAILINFLLRKRLLKFVRMQNMPDVNLEEALAKGENEFIEFKSKQSLKNPDTLLKSIASLANSGGGIVFIGIDDNGALDPFTIESIKEIDDLKLQITNYIKENIRPIPDIFIEPINLSENNILIKLKIIPPLDTILYSFRGVFYRRLGNADIPMDFWSLQKILSTF